MFFLDRGDTIPTLFLIAWSGSSFGAGLFLGPSIQADVIDYDELHTGKRREAQYTSFWAMLPKFVAIPSAAIPIAVLGTLGYVPNVDQTFGGLFKPSSPAPGRAQPKCVKKKLPWQGKIKVVKNGVITSATIK